MKSCHCQIYLYSGCFLCVPPGSLYVSLVFPFILGGSVLSTASTKLPCSLLPLGFDQWEALARDGRGRMKVRQLICQLPFCWPQVFSDFVSQCKALDPVASLSSYMCSPCSFRLSSGNGSLVLLAVGSLSYPFGFCRCFVNSIFIKLFSVTPFKCSLCFGYSHGQNLYWTVVCFKETITPLVP